MKLLDIFVKPAGLTVRLKTRPNDDVITYVVFVRKRTSGGSLPEATWLPNLLESEGGASLVLGPERGYDILLKASIRKDGQAVIEPVLAFEDGAAFTDPIPLPNSEGPVVERGWSIVIE